MRRLDPEARRAAERCGGKVFDVMDRRAFLGALGLVAAPIATGAQMGRAWQIDTEATGRTPGVPLLGPGARRGRA